MQQKQEKKDTSKLEYSQPRLVFLGSVQKLTEGKYLRDGKDGSHVKFPPPSF